MALNDYQKPSRVGAVYGSGADGNLTISSNTQQSLTTEGCSGTSGTTSLTVDTASFSNGDLVLIHQSRGSNAGDWEINKVSSGGGTTSLTMEENLQTSYANSGDNQAQIIKIPQYQNVTANSGDNWYPADWNGGENGILLFLANDTVTIDGIIHGNNDGFRGGNGAYNQGQADCGEGTGGARTGQTSANGSGGGGASGDDNTGAGGGNGTGGGNGDNNAVGGSTSGNSGLTSITFGGGGGGGAEYNTGPGAYIAGDGGDGGGIMIIFGKNIDLNGAINSIGQDGEDGNDKAAGGGGAGGSSLLCAETIDIGTDNFDLRGGTGGSSAGSTGGAGGDGRLAVYYGDSLSGSISSTYYGTYTSEKDTDLIPGAGGALFMGQL